MKSPAWRRPSPRPCPIWSCRQSKDSSKARRRYFPPRDCIAEQHLHIITHSVGGFLGQGDGLGQGAGVAPARTTSSSSSRNLEFGEEYDDEEDEEDVEYARLAEVLLPYRTDRLLNGVPSTYYD